MVVKLLGAKAKNWIYYAINWSMPLVRIYRKELLLLFLLIQRLLTDGAAILS